MDKTSTLFSTGMSRSRRQTRLLKNGQDEIKRKNWIKTKPRSSSPRMPGSSGITLSTNLPPRLRSLRKTIKHPHRAKDDRGREPHKSGFLPFSGQLRSDRG